MTDSEVMAIAERAAKALKIPTPRFRRWTLARGHGSGGSFSLPRWIANESEAFRTYYIVHEVVHNTGHLDHGRTFKRIERRVLRQFGILVARYGKAYPLVLTDLDGNVTYRSWRPSAQLVA